MADNKKIEDANEKLNLITLTDEDSGEDKDFEVIATAEIDGKVYYALIETDEENDEYIILNVTESGDDLLFETVDDDEEFYKIEDYFNDLLFGEEDYDN